VAHRGRRNAKSRLLEEEADPAASELAAGPMAQQEGRELKMARAFHPRAVI
jgi:hypothetical protein